MRGFSLVEILITLAIIALLAAVVLPTVTRRISDGESGTVASTLSALREAVLEYRADVRRYPTHLRYLTAAPVTASDLCGQTVPSAFLAGWKGPYVNRAITTAGAVVDDMIVRDSIARSPSTFTASTTGEILIEVQNVDSSVARRIEVEQDATPDFATGTIRWTEVSGGRGIVKLAIPVRGC